VSGAAAVHFLPVAELGRQLRAGSITPLNLVEALVERNQALDPLLRSTITLSSETALEEAEVAGAEIRRGAWRGPLHGIPIGIKDCIATAGIRTTANSRLLSDWVPGEDAPAVTALRSAGAIVLAKLNLNEFAWSIPSEDDLCPPPRNPWRTASRAMGSSSGSAVAVASGLCPAAIGTDAGGSVRQPASNCGVIGLKPTHGLAPADATLGPPSICDVGPLARTVEDVAILLDALTGGGSGYARALADPPKPRRLGVLRSFVEGTEVDPEVSAAFAEAVRTLASLGIEVREVDVEGLTAAAAADFVVLNAEAFAAHEETLRKQRTLYGASAAAYHLQGAFLSAADYIAALRVGEVVRERVNRVLREVDFLAAPVVPVLTSEAARAKKAQPHTGGTAVFTAPFNLTGHPALALPCGMSAAGMPIGLQLVGATRGERDLLQVALMYEQVTAWHQLHPGLEAAAVSG
jgi:aspartyl-tRNA(Asn)/glutamyl-tRNA(Gln) amidotransferase subunit A